MECLVYEDARHIYSIVFECGQVVTGHCGHSNETRSKETTRTSILGTWICQPWCNTTQIFSIASITKLYPLTTSRYMDHVIQELIALHFNMSREDGPCCSKVWKPIPHPLKQQWQASSGDVPWLVSHWFCVTVCFGCCLRSCLIFILSLDFFIHLYLCCSCTLPFSLILNCALKQHCW